MQLTLKWYIDGVDSGKFSPQEVISAYWEKAKAENEKYFAYIRFHEDYVEKNKDEFAKRPLKWAPIAIKDNVLTKGLVTSFASSIAKDYISPYSATFFEKLEDVGALMIGKTNMDEFAMGSSTETSVFGPSKNPHDLQRVPGWSSGGSAVAVASDLCLAGIGTDTAWSVRQPAALCGVVGLKPTYGRVSRYGIMPMANSLDQVGTFTKTVEDAALLLASFAWYDERDAQSVNKEIDDIQNIDFDDFDIKNCRIALPKEFISEGLNPEIKEQLLSIVEKLRKAGAQVDEVQLPTLKYVLPIYYTLMPAELSTNLARFDGIRFGLQKNTMQFDSIQKYYEAVRTEGFGDEALRRIFTWTYVLSSENYENYYLQAKKAQQQMQDEFDQIFANYDFVIGSTTPDVAWKFGEKIDDPVQMYLADIYTVPANICGLPGLSLPAGFVEKEWSKLPWGMQILGDKWTEAKVLKFAKWIEGNIN